MQRTVEEILVYANERTARFENYKLNDSGLLDVDTLQGYGKRVV